MVVYAGIRWMYTILLFLLHNCNGVMEARKLARVKIGALIFVYTIFLALVVLLIYKELTV